MRIHAHNFKTIFITAKPLLQTVLMIAVYVTILKVDVHNNFLKCVVTDYEIENELKKKFLIVKHHVMQRTHRTDSDNLFTSVQCFF